MHHNNEKIGYFWLTEIEVDITAAVDSTIIVYSNYYYGIDHWQYFIIMTNIIANIIITIFAIIIAILCLYNCLGVYIFCSYLSHITLFSTKVMATTEVLRICILK